MHFLKSFPRGVARITEKGAGISAFSGSNVLTSIWLVVSNALKSVVWGCVFLDPLSTTHRFYFERILRPTGPDLNGRPSPCPPPWPSLGFANFHTESPNLVTLIGEALCFYFKRCEFWIHLPVSRLGCNLRPWQLTQRPDTKTQCRNRMTAVRWNLKAKDANSHKVQLDIKGIRLLVRLQKKPTINLSTPKGN